MSEIRVADVVEVPAQGPGRQGKMDVVIAYAVDEVRQYQIRMPREDYTPEAAKKRIEADELERLKLVNQTFTVGPPASKSK